MVTVEPGARLRERGHRGRGDARRPGAVPGRRRARRHSLPGGTRARGVRRGRRTPRGPGATARRLRGGPRLLGPAEVLVSPRHSSGQSPRPAAAGDRRAPACRLSRLRTEDARLPHQRGGGGRRRDAHVIAGPHPARSDVAHAPPGVRALPVRGGRRVRRRHHVGRARRAACGDGAGRRDVALVQSPVLRSLMVERARDPARYARVHDVRVPTLIYGTAWKEGDTARLARMAIDAGFRGIDTANQRRHYVEADVGEALAGALAAGGLRREDVFLQTKFTYVDGQDHRLPYDPSASLATQVEQSFASSLQHLGVDYLDSYVLHGPSVRHGLSADDWETWEAMERLHGAGRTRLLGVSNVNVGQLAELYAGASTKPAIVQNRCFAAMGWDRAVRQFCGERDILYQGFSLLTANREALRHRRVHEIASRTGRTVPQVIFRFALQVGMTALTGTASAPHMAEDRIVYDFELQPGEVPTIEKAVA